MQFRKQHRIRNFLAFLKVLFWYALSTRWAIILLFLGAIVVMGWDLYASKATLKASDIPSARDHIWSSIIEHYVAFGTFVVAFAAWFSNVRRDWRDKLPKRLSVYFSLPNGEMKKIVMQCNYAYLSGESDIRAMGMQIGAQISDSRQLKFNAANIKWQETDVIYSCEQIHNCDPAFFDGGFPFRHYVLRFELSEIPKALDEQFIYRWLPPYQSLVSELQYTEQTEAVPDVNFWEKIKSNDGYFDG